MQPNEETGLLEREDWESLSAELIHLDAEARERVFERVEIEPQLYADSQRHWGQVMHAEIMAGDMTGAKAYGARCAAELERRKKLSSNAEESTLTLGPAPIARPVSAIPPVAAPPPPVAGGEMPTYLQQQPPAITQAKVNLGSTTSMTAPKENRTLPFRRPDAGAPPLPPSSPPAPGEKQRDPFGETLETASAVLPMPPLPFVKSSPKKEGK